MPVFTGKFFSSNCKKRKKKKEKKKKGAGTKYRLKLGVLCDLLEIVLCTLGPEASVSSS